MVCRGRVPFAHALEPFPNLPLPLLHERRSGSSRWRGSRARTGAKRRPEPVHEPVVARRIQCPQQLGSRMRALTLEQRMYASQPELILLRRRCDPPVQLADLDVEVAHGTDRLTEPGELRA